jgi:hypothetical protein
MINKTFASKNIKVKSSSFIANINIQRNHKLLYVRHFISLYSTAIIKMTHVKKCKQQFL